MKVVGTYNGTGAAVYICLGFIPDNVKLTALEDGDLAHAEWSRSMRAAEVSEGIRYVGSSGALQVAALTAGNGISPYYGGDLLTSSNQTSVTYGEGVYLELDTQDYKATDITSGSAAIDTWTLDTLANRTGHFNNDVTGTYIGEGSRITILEKSTGMIKEAVIEALTAGQGISADEVTLSVAIGSGTVLSISGMYSFKPVALGKTTKAGIKISATTVVNVNDEIQLVEADGDDRV